MKMQGLWKTDRREEAWESFTKAERGKRKENAS